MSMGDYRYTELSYKLPPLLRAPAVWVVPVWLIRRLMREWCHLYAILIEILQPKYFQYFNYLFLLLLISLETITPHVRRVLLYSRFYVHKFLQLPHPTDGRVVYMISHFMTRCISQTRSVHSVGVMVSSFIQISTRSATINKPKGADKGYSTGSI